MGKTNIEWTNRTWNPIVGCSRVSEGCRNCYAERMAGTRLKHTERYKGLTKPGPDGPLWTGETRFIKEEFNTPQSWRDPQKVFVCDMGDLFHESIADPQIEMVLQMPLRGAHRHTYQILTKRIERARDFFAHFWNHCYRTPEGEWIPINPARNVWIGTSVEDQKTADERIPILLQIPAAVRFVSYEPALGPVDFIPYTGHQVHCCKCRWHRTEMNIMPQGKDWWCPECSSICYTTSGIHQIIFGGESGPRKRPVDLAWAYEVRDNCKETGTAFFMKQVDKVQPIPDDLMIREFPNGGRDA